MKTEPIIDYIVIAIPESETLEGEDLQRMLNAQAQYQIMVQYERPPRILLMGRTEWLITSDPAEVESFPLGHDCPACLAGKDRAQAFLKEFPDRRLAIANLHYTEVWT